MKNLFLILFIFFVYELSAQINPKTRWGNVSQEEIDYKEVPFEKDAGAVVLYEEGFMNMRFPIQTTVYRRIKILSEKGIEEANRSLHFQHKYKLQNINGLKAQTINFENGKPVKYELKRSDFYYKELNDVFTSVDFTFPNIKVGSIIEYEYTLYSENMRWINAWYFQDRIPTLYSSIKINPEGLNAGFATIAVGELFVKKYKKSQDGSNQHQWVLTDIPGYTSYTFNYNQEDQRERLILQLKKYYKWKDNYYNDSPELVEITTKWTDLTKEVEDRQKSFNNPAFAKSLLDEIGKSDDEFIYLKNICQYFKNNYTWNGYTSTMPIPEMTNRRLHREKSGSVADLNLHLYSLLNAANLQVELVILSTRAHGKIITSYPYLGQFNAVVNMVTLKDGRSFFIDASDLSDEVGYMPLKNYNQYGLVVDPKKETFISMDAPLSELYLSQTYALVNGKMNLVKITKTNGYFNSDRDRAEKSVENYLNLNFTEKNKSQTTLMDDKYLGSKTVYEADLNQPFYNIQNPLSTILKTYRFDEETRERAVEFEFPLYYKIISTLRIPENYSVEIPKDFTSQHKGSDENLIYFQSAEVKDGNLQILTELYIGKSVFVNQFKEVKDFFRKSNLDAAKTILLKKN